MFNIILCILPFITIFLTFKFLEYKSPYSIYGRKREYRKMFYNKINRESSIKNLSFKNYRNVCQNMPILYAESIIAYNEVILNDTLYAIFIIGEFSEYSKFYFSEFMFNSITNKYYAIGVLQDFTCVYSANEYAKKQGVIFNDNTKSQIFKIPIKHV